MRANRTLVLLVAGTAALLGVAIILGVQSRNALQSPIPALGPAAEGPAQPQPAPAPSAQLTAPSPDWKYSPPEPPPPGAGAEQLADSGEKHQESEPRWVVPGPPASYRLPTVDWEALMNLIDRRLGEADLRSIPPPEPTDAALTLLGGRLEEVAKKVVDSDAGRDLVDYYKAIISLGRMPRASDFTATLKKSHEKFLEEEAANYINVSHYYRQIGKDIRPDWDRLKEAKMKLWVNAYVHMIAIDRAIGPSE